MQRITSILCFLSLLSLAPACAQETSGSPFFQEFTASSGDFTFSSDTRIVLSEADQDLLDILTVPRGWLEKLRYATGLNLQITIGVAATADDIVLTKTHDADFAAKIASRMVTLKHSNGTDEKSKDIGDFIGGEGFKYKASASGVQLQYEEAGGGLRAIQALTRLVMKSSAEAGNHRKLPYGEGFDYPEHKDRRIMIDVGRHYIETETLIGLMEKMSLHKMNVLQMHLNDDFRPLEDAHNWDRVRSRGAGAMGVGAFRLEHEDVRLRPHGYTAASPKTYSRADWAKIEAAAKRYGIKIIPEFNAPGHSAAWYEVVGRLDDSDPNKILFHSEWDGHNYRIMNVNNAANRAKAVTWISDLIKSYKDWFETSEGTVHVGGEESHGNGEASVGAYLNDLYTALHYHPTSNPQGYPEIEVWVSSLYGEYVPYLNSNTYRYIQWFKELTRLPGIDDWVDIDGDSFYHVPGASGDWRLWGIVAKDTYDKIYQRRVDAYVSANNVVLPSGLGAAVWNDFAHTFYGYPEHHIPGSVHPNVQGDSPGEEMMNGGVLNSIPTMGLLGWFGYVENGSGDKVNFEGVRSSFEGWIPVSQELSSYWVRDRFPYLTGAQAMTILMDTQRFRQLWSNGTGSGAKQCRGTFRLVRPPTDAEWASYASTVTFFNPGATGTCAGRESRKSERERYGNVRGDKDQAWLGWDRSDMLRSFGGPVDFDGSFVADLVGEGNPMANGLICTDIALQLSEKSISACDESVWSNVISGTGSLHKTGIGKLKLTGVNTFSGGVQLDGGQLEIAAAGNLGTGGLALSGGTLSFPADVSMDKDMVLEAGGGGINANGKDVAMAGVISGTGQLRISSVETMPILQQATITVIRGISTEVVSTVMITVGIVATRTPGTVGLSGTNTFSGGLLLESGVLAVSANSALGNAARGVSFSGGTLSFGSNFDFARVITLVADGEGAIDTDGKNIQMAANILGSGSFVKTGAGNLEFTGVKTYTGETRVAQGLLITDLANLPDVSDIIVESGATIQLSAGANSKHDGDISGDGVFEKTGSGELTLRGVSSATWDIKNGKLKSENDFLADIAINRGGGRAFEFGSSSDSTYGGVLSGNGQIIKSGTSALTITGDSSAFAGSFDIEANSTMFVDNKLGGEVNVKGSGALGGRGEILGDVVVDLGGRLADSRVASFYGLTISGNLDLNGIYEVNFGKGIKVSGTADISTGDLVVLGGLVNPFIFNDSQIDNDRSQFLVLETEGALTGEFASVDASGLPFAEVELNYDTDGDGSTVRLMAGLNAEALQDLLGEEIPMVMPDLGDAATEQDTDTVVEPVDVLLPDVNYNRNLIAFLVETNRLQEDDAQKNPVLTEIAEAIMLIPEGENQEAQRDMILDSVFAEALASTKAALISSSSNLRTSAIVQSRLASGLSSGSGGSGQSPRFSLKHQKWGLAATDAGPAIWAKALITRGANNGGRGFREIKHKGNSILLGGDGAFSENLRLGIFGGTSRMDFEQEGDLPSSGEDKSKHFGIYGSWSLNRLSLRGGGSYTQHEIETSRRYIVNDINDKLYSRNEPRTYNYFTQVGYQAGSDDLMFEPFVGISHIRHRSKPFEERLEDGTVKSLIQESGTSMSTLEFGLHVSVPTPAIAAGARTRGMFAWNISLKEPDILVPQTIGNSQARNILGTPISGDSFILDAGLDIDVDSSKVVELSFSYSKQASGNSNNNLSLLAQFKYNF